MANIQLLLRQHVGAPCAPVVKVGVNDEFGRSGPAKELVSYFHLDAASIAAKAKEAIALKK